MSVAFLITTYNRQESCQRLVDALQGQGEIVVLNDGCGYRINGCTQVFQPSHYGKQRYWMTVNNLFHHRPKADYYFMLPDDFLPKEDMVIEAINIWQGIQDPQKICLNLATDRMGCACWTKFEPQDMGNVWLTQWVDMCFLCEERFFTTIHHINEIRMNWNSGRVKSSGVGSQISRRLYSIGYNLYQVKESLVVMQPEHYMSQMHEKR
jgi:glycosyltransferase involved in cell wall biosynthesis